MVLFQNSLMNIVFKEPHLFQMEISCPPIRVLIVTFNQFIASFLNLNINFLQKKNFFKKLCISTDGLLKSVKSMNNLRFSENISSSSPLLLEDVLCPDSASWPRRNWAVLDWWRKSALGPLKTECWLLRNARTPELWLSSSVVGTKW